MRKPDLSRSRMIALCGVARLAEFLAGVPAPLHVAMPFSGIGPGRLYRGDMLSVLLPLPD